MFYRPRGCVIAPGGVLSPQGVCYHPRGCVIAPRGVLSPQGVCYHPRGCAITPESVISPQGGYKGGVYYHPTGGVLSPQSVFSSQGGCIIRGCAVTPGVVLSPQGVCYHPRGGAVTPGGVYHHPRVYFHPRGGCIITPGRALSCVIYGSEYAMPVKNLFIFDQARIRQDRVCLTLFSVKREHVHIFFQHPSVKFLTVKYLSAVAYFVPGSSLLY